MPQSMKGREERVRRALAKAGMRLRKAPVRSLKRRDALAPGYVILDTHDAASAGREPVYEAELRQVEWFAFAHWPEDEQD